MEDDVQMMAMQEMMGGGMPPMDGGMPPMPPSGGGAPMPPGGEMGDPSGVTEVSVPNFALPAVLELLEVLESEMAGAGMGQGGQMSGGMPPMM
jgi:hypothetical protein